MRTIPVDTNRVSFIGSGKHVDKAEYVELTDGSRKRSGNQATNDDGVPLWTVDVFLDDDDARRAEVVSVTVAMHDEPRIEKFKVVKFRDLVATIWVDQGGRAQTSLKASGIDGQGGQHKPAPQAA